MTLILTTTPVARLHAEDRYLVIQYQFQLSKKPKFRQLNPANQEGVGSNLWTYSSESGKPAIIVPLYSTNPRRPGLFNSLDKPPSKEDEGKRRRGAEHHFGYRGDRCLRLRHRQMHSGHWRWCQPIRGLRYRLIRLVTTWYLNRAPGSPVFYIRANRRLRAGREMPSMAAAVP